DARVGAAERRFAALAAGGGARPRPILVGSPRGGRGFPPPPPPPPVPPRGGRPKKLGKARGPPPRGAAAAPPPAGGPPAPAPRRGPDGRTAWEQAKGGKAGRVRGRRPPGEIVEALAFPEAVANELTLRRALGALVDRVLARPERGGRFIRKLALSARLVGGGSWRRTVTLREPAADVPRLRSVLGPKLVGLPAPVLPLPLRLGQP